MLSLQYVWSTQVEIVVNISSALERCYSYHSKGSSRWKMARHNQGRGPKKGIPHLFFSSPNSLERQQQFCPRHTQSISIYSTGINERLICTCDQNGSHGVFCILSDMCGATFSMLRTFRATLVGIPDSVSTQIG